MSKPIANGLSALLYALAVAVITLALFGGIAIIASQGSAQVCERNGGHWYANVSIANQPTSGVRECR